MTTQTTQVMRGDLAEAFYDAVIHQGTAAWDIETSGLDWSQDQIGTCQLARPDGAIAVVQLEPWTHPERLVSLLADRSVRKVFHHAPFDLRFMVYRWKSQVRNVACTKVASKVLDPHLESSQHSLQAVLGRYLGIHISKDQRVSNWLAADLDDDQLRYAAGDVAHLLALEHLLSELAEARGLSELLTSSFHYLPTRVQLELRGCGDVFAY